MADDAKSTGKELMKKIESSLQNLTTLEIVTAVGEVSYDAQDQTYKPADEGYVDAIFTKIDLVQGDIKTVYDPKFISGEYQNLLEVHKNREAQGHQIVEANIAALKKLFDLAKEFLNE